MNTSTSTISKKHLIAIAVVLALGVGAGAFILQWGMGIIIDALGAAGYAASMAHTGAFTLLFVLQALSLCWFYFCAWKAARRTP